MSYKDSEPWKSKSTVAGSLGSIFGINNISEANGTITIKNIDKFLLAPNTDIKNFDRANNFLSNKEKKAVITVLQNLLGDKALIPPSFVSDF